MKKLAKVIVIFILLIISSYFVDHFNSRKQKKFIDSMSHIQFKSSGKIVALDNLQYEERLILGSSQLGYLYFKDNSSVDIEIYEEDGYFCIGERKPTMLADGWFYVYD